MTSQSPQPDPQLQRLAQLEIALENATQTIANLEASIRTMQSSSPQPVSQPAAQPEVTRTELVTSPTLFTTSSVVRARAPDPFDGEDPSLAPGFIQALDQYLNLVTFPNDAAKLELAVTYFRLPAQEWVLGAYREKVITTFAELEAKFREVYHMDMEVELEINLDKLTSLRQGDTQTVSNHYSKFLSLSFAAGASQDASNAQLFFQSLKFQLRRSMLRDANLKRSDIKSVLAAALRHERAFLTSKNATEAPLAPRRAPVAPAPPAPAVFQRLGPRVAPPAVPIPAGGPVPMDLDAAQAGNAPARRPRLAPADRPRRVAQNLCIVCGSPDHFRDACPHSNYRRPRAAALNAAEAAPPPQVQPQPAPVQQPELAYIDVDAWDSDDALPIEDA